MHVEMVRSCGKMTTLGPTETPVFSEAENMTNCIVIVNTRTLRRRSAAAYVAGYLKTVAHAIFSHDAVYLYLYMYRCGCTYRVTLRVFS